jgi:hypothetical protein
MPFVDVAGKIGATVPLQIVASEVNTGVTEPAFTVCVIVVVVAHWPAVGVNVYVPLVVLSTVAGLHVPLILSNDVPDNIGAVEPVQIAGKAANVGTVGAVIVCVIVVVVAHWPTVGVNVYVPLVVLSTVAGLHEPVMLSNDVPGKIGAAVPLQIAGKAANVGVTPGVTVSVIVVVVAHWPAVGVNVYVPLIVLSTVAGLHVPLILSNDAPGKIGAAVPLQIDARAVNVGVTFGVTVSVNIVVGTAHWPAVAVNVYVPLIVLSIVAGLHVPVILSNDVPGKVGAIEPLQIVASGVNVGVTEPAFTVCAIVVVVAHW